MKYTQRQLMNEGLWNKFKKVNSGFGSVIKQAARAGAEATKLVAPEIYNPIKNANEWRKGVYQKVREAGIPFNRKLLNWIREQGKWALTTPKNTGSYSDGMQHFNFTIAEKGINQKTGKETVGRLFKDPNAIVGWNPVKEEFKWIVKPRWDGFRTEPDPANPGKTRAKYGDEEARVDDDYYKSIHSP